MIARRLAGSSMLLASSLLLACGGLLKRAQVNHYALEPIAADAKHVEVAGAPVGLGAVELPPGLDRPDIVVRSARWCCIAWRSSSPLACRRAW